MTRAAIAILLVTAGLVGGLFLHRLTHTVQVVVADSYRVPVVRSVYAQSAATHLEGRDVRYSWDDYAAIGAIGLGATGAAAVGRFPKHN